MVRSKSFEHIGRATTIRDIGRVDHGPDEEVLAVDHPAQGAGFTPFGSACVGAFFLTSSTLRNRAGTCAVRPVGAA